MLIHPLEISAVSREPAIWAQESSRRESSRDFPPGRRYASKIPSRTIECGGLDSTSGSRSRPTELRTVTVTDDFGNRGNFPASAQSVNSARCFTLLGETVILAPGMGFGSGYQPVRLLALHSPIERIAVKALSGWVTKHDFLQRAYTTYVLSSFCNVADPSSTATLSRVEVRRALAPS
jgi:hypothetical protein